MKKSELISLLQQRHALSPEEAHWLVNRFFQLVIEACQQHTKVELRGFGTFFTKNHLSRQFLNPVNKKKYGGTPVKKLVFHRSKTAQQLRDLAKEAPK
jgi:nucleoid DNA-binding protein